MALLDYFRFEIEKNSAVGSTYGEFVIVKK